VKVILREHVDQLGEQGEIVTVAAGYARNYLLPKGLAYEATPGNLKQIELQRRVWDARESREVGEAEALAERIATTELVISKKAGESGTLYGSVTSGDIADLLSAKGIEVERKRIVLTEPIKSLGEHEIQIKIHRKVDGKAQLVVVAEEEAD
jgi:large subunit ribosomal protein L9